MTVRRLPLDPAEVAEAQQRAVEFVRKAGFDLMEGPVLLEEVERTAALPGETPPASDDPPLWRVVLSLPVRATSTSSAYLRNLSLGINEPAIERTERTFYLDPGTYDVLSMSNDRG